MSAAAAAQPEPACVARQSEPAAQARQPGAVAKGQQPEVVGYVEAATPARVLGWAWAPGSPADAVRVELRLGDAVVAEAAADMPREDLVRNGVGDGRHAFDLPVPETHRARAAELTVHARLSGGEAVKLAMPAPPHGVGERLDRLQAATDAMINSQRMIHRNLQAALLGRGEEDGNSEHAARQAALAGQLVALEVFMTRLDDRLASLHTPPPLPRPGYGTVGALGLAMAALCLSAWELLRSLPG